ncbi:16S rRNA (uracil(1498)-N(3))-methyltransferase [Paenibacillus doosanensis]|uniref:Ribosomal RNA small subunit methyltransferase E n=1 Tax=Paenibacillus konkukensis TaxID=2020716 RepID=A0ABY4S0A7_9BACL|nr:MULTISPECIES: 16S rRNA (uracil(1498)-N(3))-methyltransferase [Paenibacillus]MCS7464889.1 16S rRNA (uracil(1498)-N(3))-methyltransferase [Paenibacillus doosanensis]UQZ86977.1 Ribosomal RNA small subunit methyltransferase E [Paenibacillus konkukensis]
MQRYFIAPELFADTFVTITGDDAHHIVRVMRGKAGDQLIVSDGVSREALVKLREPEKDRVIADIVERLAMNNEPSVEVWIAQSLPKGDKMELVIQKGTEIGADRFIPFVSERTVVQLDAKKEGKRIERWQKIAKEAAEQAHRNRIPAVEAPLAWKQLLKLAGEADAAWICYEKQEGLQFRTQIQEALSKGKAFRIDSDSGLGGDSGGTKRVKLLLIIGPEGGFTEQEVEAAEAAGCRSVSLGRRILRTETAAMVGLTCILYETGEMGG